MTPEVYSHLLKIKNGRTIEEMLSAANRILELGAANYEVADAVLKAVEAGKYFPKETIANIVGQSKSKKLYLATNDSLLSDKFSLLELHRQSYPDSKIEELLCDELYRVTSDDGWEYGLIYRKSVVESLRDHGIATALPTLEAILYERVPKVAVTKLVSDAMPQNEIDGLSALMLQCEEEFVTLLRNAILNIKKRGEEFLPIETNKVASDLFEYLQKAKDQLSRGELDEALGTARKAAEAISADIYMSKGLEKSSGKSLADLKLQFRIEAIKPHISDLTYSHLKALQVFGNIGSHHRNEKESMPTDKTVKTVLSHLEELATLVTSVR